MDEQQKDRWTKLTRSLADERAKGYDGFNILKDHGAEKAKLFRRLALATQAYAFVRAVRAKTSDVNWAKHIEELFHQELAAKMCQHADFPESEKEFITFLIGVYDDVKDLPATIDEKFSMGRYVVERVIGSFDMPAAATLCGFHMKASQGAEQAIDILEGRLDPKELKKSQGGGGGCAIIAFVILPMSFIGSIIVLLSLLDQVM